MPVTPNSRCATIADAILNLRRIQLDELALEILSRDSDWGEALGRRLTGQTPLRSISSDVSEESLRGSIIDAPPGALFPADGDDGDDSSR